MSGGLVIIFTKLKFNSLSYYQRHIDSQNYLRNWPDDNLMLIIQTICFQQIDPIPFFPMSKIQWRFEVPHLHIVAFLIHFPR